MAERSETVVAVSANIISTSLTGMGQALKKMRRCRSRSEEYLSSPSSSSSSSSKQIDYREIAKTAADGYHVDRQLVEFQHQILEAREASCWYPSTKRKPQTHASIVSGQSHRMLENAWYLLESTNTCGRIYIQPRRAPDRCAYRLIMTFLRKDDQVLSRVSFPWGMKPETCSPAVATARALAFAWGQSLIPCGWSAVSFECELVDSIIYVTDLRIDPKVAKTLSPEHRTFCARWAVVRAIFDAAPDGRLDRFNRSGDGYSTQPVILLAPTIDLTVYVGNFLAKSDLVSEIRKLQDIYHRTMLPDETRKMSVSEQFSYLRALLTTRRSDEVRHWERSVGLCVEQLVWELASSLDDKLAYAIPGSAIVLKPQCRNVLLAPEKHDVAVAGEHLRLDLVTSYVIDWAYNVSERNANLVAYPGCNVGPCCKGHRGTYHPARIPVSAILTEPNEFVADDGRGPVFVTSRTHWGWEAFNLLLAIGSNIVFSDGDSDLRDVLREDLIKYLVSHVPGNGGAEMVERKRKFLDIDRTDQAALEQGVRELYSKTRLPALHIHIVTSVRRGPGRTLWCVDRMGGALLECRYLGNTLVVDGFRTETSKKTRSDCLYLDHQLIFSNDVVTRCLSVGNACVCYIDCASPPEKEPLRATYHRPDLDTAKLSTQGPGQWFDMLTQERIVTKAMVRAAMDNEHGQRQF